MQQINNVKTLDYFDRLHVLIDSNINRINCNRERMRKYHSRTTISR